MVKALSIMELFQIIKKYISDNLLWVCRNAMNVIRTWKPGTKDWMSYNRDGGQELDESNSFATNCFLFSTRHDCQTSFFCFQINCKRLLHLGSITKKMDRIHLEITFQQEREIILNKPTAFVSVKRFWNLI